MPIKVIIEKIKAFTASWRGKLNRKQLIVIALVILVLLAFILTLLQMKQLLDKRKVTPLPSPSPTPSEEISAPSAYATDSAVLAIEEDLETLEKDLLETNLYETGLNPPVLDMKVEFKE